VTNHTHASRTDPDATLAEKKGTPRQLKYRVYQSIDADSRVILDTHVTTGARHDTQPYLEQLRRIRDRHTITIREALADRGYDSAAIVEALQGQDIETYIPLFHQGSGRNCGTAPGLAYEPEADRFRCPKGKYLHSSSALYESYKRYTNSSADCHNCPQASSCPAKTRKAAPLERIVLRSLDQDLFDRVQAQMVEPEFRKRLSERMWKSEGLFAEAK
jgi:hypothetical protein